MKIVVILEGDLEQRAQEECATMDSILDTLGQELEVFAQGWGLTSYIDDAYLKEDSNGT